MQLLFFTIPIKRSLIGHGTCLLFMFLLSLILPMEVGVVVHCRTKFGMFEATTIAAATLLTLTSLFMIAISICLVMCEIYNTWMFCTIIFFLIQTVVIICLAAVNGSTIFVGGPFSSKIALAQVEILFVLPPYLFVWAHVGHLWLCLHSLYLLKKKEFKKIATANEGSPHEAVPNSAESLAKQSKSQSEFPKE